MEIAGISKEQKRLLNAMWKMDSKEELLEWKATLTPDKQKTVDILQELMVAEYLDHTVTEDHQTYEAREILMKIK